MSLRLLYVVSHPIQYQAPLLRRLAAEPWASLRVLFERLPPASGSFDPGFGQQVAWDVPLRDGYDSALLTPRTLADEVAAADVVWVHGWQSWSMKRLLRLARRLGKPVLLRAENWDGAMPDGQGPRAMAKRMLLRWVFARCSAFLAIGRCNAEYYRRRGIADERIFTVPYAVDNGFFAAGADQARLRRDAVRAELNLDPRRPVILFAGKLQQRKRPDLLVQAWRRLGPEPQLLMVGSGELEAELKASCPDVIFRGFVNQSHLPAFYAAADVFVLPSEREPWGLAVNEAMACGTAVVASDQVGSAYDLIDPSVGAVFPAGDAEALAVALADVVGRADTAGQAARRRIASWSFAEDLEGLRRAAQAVTS